MLETIMYKIMSDIEIPRSRVGRPFKYPFRNMQIGESIFVAVDDIVLARAAAGQYKRAHPGWDYVSRSDDGGGRIWRTA